MAYAEVFNDNVYPHTEQYKGETITIPAKGSIKMDWEEAVQFLGQFTGFAPKLPTGDNDPRGYKMLRLGPPDAPIFRDDGLTCHADGKRAATKADLDAALEKYADRRVVDEDAEKYMREIDALKARLQAVEERRGPGRPRKDEASPE